MIRKLQLSDVDRVAEIYDKIHTNEEAGITTIGWIRDVYPTKDTVMAALDRDDMFVLENEDGIITASAIINKVQVDSYADGEWEYQAEDDKVMVIHTLVVDPDFKGKGTGTEFIRFYEEFAKEDGCSVLRLDTNARNLAARSLYEKLGYREAGIVPCEFNGIPGVQLVLIEKSL